MKKTGSYVGSIGNSGSQTVKAPLSQDKAKPGKVTKGNDLRTGKGK